MLNKETIYTYTYYIYYNNKIICMDFASMCTALCLCGPYDKLLSFAFVVRMLLYD